MCVAGMERLQAQMEPGRLRWRGDPARPVRTHMATGYCALQQVSYSLPYNSSHEFEII